MAQQGGGQAQMCDYCQQKPKFPPYNYCGKGCGAKAKASGMATSRNPALCKQCGQRPVHRGHEFCGRNCANTWQASNGQINTGGNGGQHHRNTMPSFQTQNSNQGGGDGGGDGGGLKGFVKGLKSLVSQNQQSQPAQSQQRSASPDPTLISPPITPMPSSGTGGTSTPTTPGLNQQYYTPPSPTSPGVPDPNTNSQTNGHHISSGQKSKSRTMTMALKPANSTGDDDTNPDPNADPNQDPVTASNNHQFPNGAVPIQAQAQLSIQVNSPTPGAGGHGNGNWDPNDPFALQQHTSMCRLNGCNKPAYVDPITRRQGEYCSQRHREDATIFGQVNPCIMCLKMPRSTSDHFCSRACRDKALRP